MVFSLIVDIFFNCELRYFISLWFQLLLIMLFYIILVILIWPNSINLFDSMLKLHIHF